MKRFWSVVRRRPTLITLAVVAVVVAVAYASVGSRSAPDVPTAAVAKGEFVDAIEIRGDIRPLRSVVLAAPMQSGELQIVKLAKNGSMVNPGDVVVEFDASTLRRYCAHGAGTRIYRTDQDDDTEGRTTANDADGDHVVIRTNGRVTTVEAYSAGRRITQTACVP